MKNIYKISHMDGCSEIKHEIDNCNLYSNYEKGKVREKRQINKQIRKKLLAKLARSFDFANQICNLTEMIYFNGYLDTSDSNHAHIKRDLVFLYCI